MTSRPTAGIHKSTRSTATDSGGRKHGSPVSDTDSCCGSRRHEKCPDVLCGDVHRFHKARELFLGQRLLRKPTPHAHQSVMHTSYSMLLRRVHSSLCCDCRTASTDFGYGIRPGKTHLTQVLACMHTYLITLHT